MVSSRSISRLKAIDWDFTGRQSESAFSAIHWHPGRFASQIPAALIGVLSRPGQVVLDPFAGSGTTLVEAQRLGRSSVGIDLSPIACVLARAKTLPLSGQRIGTLVSELALEAQQVITAGHSKQCPRPPTSVQGAKWYTQRVYSHLCRLWGLFESYAGSKRTLAQATFSAILLPVCRETRHWGYVCDNSTPIANHGRDVLAEFTSVLRKFQIAYQERDAEILARDGQVVLQRSRIICGSALNVLRGEPSRTCDLIVTSPPYFGVSDYMKAQRLSFEWFGRDIEPLRLQEIGARSKRHRKQAQTEYIEEMLTVFSFAVNHLKRGSYLCVVVGESGSRAAVIPALRDGLGALGLQAEFDLKRTVSAQRRQTPSLVSEHVMVFRRGGGR